MRSLFIKLGGDVLKVSFNLRRMQDCNITSLELAELGPLLQTSVDRWAHVLVEPTDSSRGQYDLLHRFLNLSIPWECYRISHSRREE